MIRGPASSLYGSSAGGVISLFTEDGPATPFVQAGISGGNDRFQKYNLKTGGELGKLNYLVSASYLNFGGYRQQSWTQNATVNSKFQYGFDATSDLTALVSAFDSPRAQDPGALTAAQVAQNRTQGYCGLDPRAANLRTDACLYQAGEAIDQQKLGLIYRKAFGEGHEVSLRNYYLWRNFVSNQPLRTSSNIEFNRLFMGGGGQYTWTGELAGHHNRFIAGFEIESQGDDRQRYDNIFGGRGVQRADQFEAADSQAIFFQNEFAILNNLELTFGGRYDKVKLAIEDRFLANGDQSGELKFDEFNPMVGLLWSPLAWLNAYANYGSAFETPTFVELTPLFGAAGGFKPDVTAQSAKNYEIGFKGIVAGRFGYELSYYHTDVSSEITNVSTIANVGVFENADTQRDGLEAAVTIKVFDGLTTTFAYTRSDFAFDNFPTTPANNGKQLPGVPPNQFYAAINYEHPSGLYVNWDYLWIDSFFADNANTGVNESYKVANLRIGRPFNAGAVRIEPYIGINNMFNEKYNGNVRLNADVTVAVANRRYFEPAPGQNYYGGVSVRYEF